MKEPLDVLERALSHRSLNIGFNIELQLLLHIAESTERGATALERIADALEAAAVHEGRVAA